MPEHHLDRVLVVGHGPAAHRLVERLRHHGHRGRVTVLGAGRHGPHQRELLPAALAGPLPRTALALPAPPGDVTVHRHTTAVALDRARRAVRDDHGVEHAYDHLVLATGAVPRDPGFDRGPRTHTLRGPDDLDPLGAARGDVAVVGAGPHGVELALTLAHRSPAARVDLVDEGPHPLARHLDDAAGAAVAAALERRGVTVRAGRRAVARPPGGLVLHGPDGGDETLTVADVVLATGAVPAGDLAASSGLATGTAGAVRVDDALTSADPRVHALGAVTGAPDLAAAHAQADVLARRLAGHDTRHRPARPVLRLRLRAGDLEVLVLGTPGGTGADETVSATDPTGSRHARLDLADGRIVRAAVVGFPAAAGPLVQHWRADRPLPDARLALLLGVPPATGTADPAELPDDAVVCVCNSVTRGRLAQAHDEGAGDVDAIAAATRATTGCGTCRATVCRLLEVFSEQDSEQDSDQGVPA